MRTIPINRELVANYPVAPFENVLQVIENQEKIAVSPVFVARRPIWSAKGVTNPKRIVLQLYEPPKTGIETYIRIMQERGKL